MRSTETHRKHSFKIFLTQLYCYAVSCLTRLFPRLQSDDIAHILKSIGFLILFLLVIPLTFSVTCISLLISFATRKPPPVNPNAKRILISGCGMTKALQLARSFYSAGHYVVLTDEYPLTTHRYSRCVSRFYVCEDTDHHDGYIQSIIDIVKKEQIDVFVPVSHSSNECVDSRLIQRLAPFNCETFHGNVEQTQMLSDKFAFTEKVRSLGLTAPKTFQITNPKQVLEFDFSKEKHPYILKSVRYDSVARANLVKLPCETPAKTAAYVNSLVINEDRPWIMQEFITGKEYCTHGVFRDGELKLHICCPSSPWLLNYKHVENKPHILKWVKDFCSKINMTGQASFDFMESEEDGLPYAIECNPRTHTAISTVYNHPLVARAYLDKEPLPNGHIEPYASARKTYWLHHELWNLLKVRSVAELIVRLKTFLSDKEAIYAVDDPLPFFLHYTVHMPYIIMFRLYFMIHYKKVDCNLGLLL